MIIESTMLDAFVQKSDEMGGPGRPLCQEYWRDMVYKPSVVIDETIDPFGPEYMAAQLGLYREISGRILDQVANEQTSFDLQFHVESANPYGQHDPAATAIHIQRLSAAIRMSKPHLGAQMLDMGCGWGLSSEYAAYLGLNVTGVDINPHFVSLVNQRAEKRKFQVRAVNATFNDYMPDRVFDLILFYECLHHAVEPWSVIGRLVESLSPGGTIVLAGEPINDGWRHWGLRLDMLAIYCVRKFGWFESGWSLDFIKTVFTRANMFVETSYDATVGHTVVARRMSTSQIGLSQIAQTCSETGWLFELDHLILQGSGTLSITFPDKTVTAMCDIENYRANPVSLGIRCGEKPMFVGTISPGRTCIVIPKSTETMKLEFDGEIWVPDIELGNGDFRSISIHLAGIRFI